MISKSIRTVTLLTLLVVGLGLLGLGLAMRATTQQFLETENAFRENTTQYFTEDWVESKPNMLGRVAQDMLGVGEIEEVRVALAAYRKTHVVRGSEDYFAYYYVSSPEVDREVAKSQLLAIANNSDDTRIVVQTATLLGDLYAQDTVQYAQDKDVEKAREAYGKAVEAFTYAIAADSSDTFNSEAKEDLEALIRMFMGESKDGEGKPASGPRPGSSDPGSGY